MKVQSGNDMQARQMGGDVAGISGTATAVGATSLTDTGAPFVSSAFVGHQVVMGGVIGVITANSTTVLTVDRWTTPGSPGGVAAATPATGVYVVLPGNAPAWFVAITANATAVSSTDTALTAEIATAGGGLIRKVAPYGHTTGAASFTLTPVYTVNGSDTIPVTVAKAGVFNSLVSGQMEFSSVLPSTAGLSAIGDSLTLTVTVTL